MPNWDSNDPREFGWSEDFRGFVPFVYHGLSFPQGVHPLVAPIFTEALTRLRAAGVSWPPARVGLGAGMWGQEYRSIAGSSVKSFHWFGIAIDVLAPWNPRGASSPDPSPYRLPDRTSALVGPLGLLWGGSPRFGSNPDRMHLECHLSPLEISGRPWPGTPAAGAGHPFPLPADWYFGPRAGPNESISGQVPSDAKWRPYLALAQVKLRVIADGYYGPTTAAAVIGWQTRHGLAADGLIGARTWASLAP